ncbi:MAG: GNAT family N-acetyltransferase [Candidatus Rokubacteria bacterium]|nr:GNAT family N-acetyltransferase [Candidatus Rokubacteria bacterium]
MTGYLHPGYAGSFDAFGRPRALPRSGAYVLERPIPGSTDRDAMGCYPLLCCAEWRALPQDLRDLEDLVSLTCVADPFAPCDRSTLEQWFDVVLDFKPHFVTELTRPVEAIVSRSHQAAVRRALRHVDVEVCHDPAAQLDQWVRLYDCLIQRHGITGIRAFSRAAFARQLALPGMVMFRATSGAGETIGMDLWYVQGDVAYGHLAAFSSRGYELRASYATKWHVLRHFHGKVRWLGLGGAAGTRPGVADGLSAFKRGWATGTRMAHLCGRILDRSRYEALCASRGTGTTRYFPAYRQEEFA